MCQYQAKCPILRNHCPEADRGRKKAESRRQYAAPPHGHRDSDVHGPNRDRHAVIVEPVGDAPIGAHPVSLCTVEEEVKLPATTVAISNSRSAFCFPPSAYCLLPSGGLSMYRRLRSSYASTRRSRRKGQFLRTSSILAGSTSAKSVSSWSAEA